jgi:hypothetical protein
MVISGKSHRAFNVINMNHQRKENVDNAMTHLDNINS